MTDNPTDPKPELTIAELAEDAHALRIVLAETRGWLESMPPSSSRTAGLERLEREEHKAERLERVLGQLAAGAVAGITALGGGRYRDSVGNVFQETGDGWQLVTTAEELAAAGQVKPC